jgi:hypothetical protein
MERSVSQKTKISRYAVELLGAMALYVIVLVAAIRAAPGIESHGLKMLACVSPMVPIALAIWAIARHFRRVDDYLRLVMLENVAVAAAVTAGASLTYGFLENAGFPKISMFAVWPVMGAAWFVLALVREFRER